MGLICSSRLLVRCSASSALNFLLLISPGSCACSCRLDQDGRAGACQRRIPWRNKYWPHERCALLHTNSGEDGWIIPGQWCAKVSRVSRHAMTTRLITSIFDFSPILRIDDFLISSCNEKYALLGFGGEVKIPSLDVYFSQLSHGNGRPSDLFSSHRETRESTISLRLGLNNRLHVFVACCYLTAA